LFVFGIVMATVLAALVVSLSRSRVRLGELDEERLRQAAQITRLESENEQLSNLVFHPSRTGGLESEPSHELLRLRGEVGALRRQTNELGRLRQENTRLSQTVTELETNEDSAQDQLIVRQTHAVEAMTALLQALQDFAAKHQGQYPDNLDQLIASGELGATNLAGNLGLSDFQFGQAAGTDPLGNPVVLKLRVPIPKPGGGAIMVVGGISDEGVPHTSTWNVSP
jgi:hypothetical protein